MAWFPWSALFSPSRRGRRPSGNPRPRTRLTVENLEERTVPSTLQVVASGSADNLTKFATLSAALAAATDSTIIQIEPGSTPGGGVVTQNNLTIQGDPAAALASLPKLDTVGIGPGATGATLTHLALGVVILEAGSNHTQVTGSTATDIDALGGTSGNGNNLIEGNTISGIVNLFGNSPGTTTGDQVLSNTFTNSTSALVFLSLQHDDGAQVQGNTFTSTATGSTAVGDFGSQGVQVQGNSVQLGANSYGIEVASTAAADASATITQNVINTGGQGVGVYALKATAGHNTSVVLAGNDLSANMMGLVVSGDGTNLGTTDAGGGGSSAGGNLFTSFTTTAGGRAAIFTMNATNGTVNATGNVWSVGHPERTVSAAAGTFINVGTLPNADYEYIQSLYLACLGRSGTTAELQPWVGALATAGRTWVANQILHSPEALIRVVDGLYVSYLGRHMDAASAPGYVTFLQSGGTEEQVMMALLTSSEFVAHWTAVLQIPGSSDANFIGGLYEALLHRGASSAEIAQWVAGIPLLGKTGIILGFMTSVECRLIEVKADYALLHRGTVPSDAEAMPWATSGMSLLTLEAGVLASWEFYYDG